MTEITSSTLADVRISSSANRVTGSGVDDDVIASDSNNVMGKLGGCVILLMIATGVAGNLLALAGITTCKALHRSHNALIASLSATDLTFNLAVMPFYADSFFRRKWVHSSAVCRWHTYFGTTVVVASAFHIAAIAMTRYYVIVHPLFYARWMASARAIVVQICIVWIASIAIVLPGVVGLFPVAIDYSDQLSRCNYLRAESKRALALIFAGGFVVPCCFMIVFYVMIWLQVRRSDLRLTFHSFSRSTATSGLIDQRREGGPTSATDPARCAMTSPAASHVLVLGKSQLLSIPQSSSLPLLLLKSCPSAPACVVTDDSLAINELAKSTRDLSDPTSDVNSAPLELLPSLSDASCKIDDVISLNQTVRRPDVTTTEPNVDRSTGSEYRVVEDEAVTNKRTMTIASSKYPRSSSSDNDQPNFLETFAVSSFSSAEPEVTGEGSTIPTPDAVINAVKVRPPPSGVGDNTGNRRRSWCASTKAVNTVADIAADGPMRRPTTSTIRRHDHLHQHHLHSLQMIMAVFLAYVITYLPFALTNLFDDRSSLGRNVYMMTSLGFWAGSCVNPLIYGIMNRQFRSAYLSVFYACARRSQSNDHGRLRV